MNTRITKSANHQECYPKIVIHDKRSLVQKGNLFIYLLDMPQVSSGPDLHDEKVNLVTIFPKSPWLVMEWTLEHAEEQVNVVQKIHDMEIEEMLLEFDGGTEKWIRFQMILVKTFLLVAYLS